MSRKREGKKEIGREKEREVGGKEKERSQNNFYWHWFNLDSNLSQLLF